MKPVATAVAAIFLVALLTACDDGGSTGADTSPRDTDPTSSATSAPTGDATGDPKTDPCDLLTKGMAEGALGVPVGPGTRTPGEGNLTCSYAPVDGTPNVFVLLTTYVVTGEAALATATSEFPDATPVPDLGDSALVSRKGRAIGVAVDDVLFAISLLRADAFSVDPAVAEAQLITLAHTVVDAR